MARPIPELSDAQRIALCEESASAFRQHVRTDLTNRTDNIPEKFWGPTIRNLKPLRVVDDRVNIKIVLLEGNGVEAGFYVQQTISSFAPGQDYFLEKVHLPQSKLTMGTLYRYKMAQPAEAGEK